MKIQFVRAIVASYRILGLVMILLSMAYGIFNITSNFDKEFRSPFDEHTHFDYWRKIYRDHRLPEVYEKIKPENYEIWHCPELQSKPKEADCKSSLQNIDEIENTASNYAPTFYFATAIISSIIDPIIETKNDFHLAKISNLAWGVISLILLWGLAREMHIPQPIIAVVIFAIAQNPAFVFASITFNQEIFVLASCILTLILYLRNLQIIRSPFNFGFWTGVASAICLSIKPTALLIVVIIATNEMLKETPSTKERILRLSAYTAFTGLVLSIGTIAINHIRGINQSDGRMRDSLVQKMSERGVLQWIDILWAQFETSTASYGWRGLTDYSIPWLFPHFHTFFLASLLIVLIVFIFTKMKKIQAPSSMNIFIGNMLGFAALPLALAIYCQLTDFPFFFQARYYLAYTCLAVVTSTAFLADIFSTASKYIASLNSRPTSYDRHHTGTSFTRNSRH